MDAHLRARLKPKTILAPQTMKKILYILILAAVSSVSFSACTEEAITPKTEEDTTGTTPTPPIDPIKP